MAQEARSIVIHLRGGACCCKRGASSLRPDQHPATGDLSICENHCLESRLCQWTRTVYRLNNCFWYSSSAKQHRCDLERARSCIRELKGTRVGNHTCKQA